MIGCLVSVMMGQILSGSIDVLEFAMEVYLKDIALTMPPISDDYRLNVVTTNINLLLSHFSPFFFSRIVAHAGMVRVSLIKIDIPAREQLAIRDISKCSHNFCGTFGAYHTSQFCLELL